MKLKEYFQKNGIKQLWFAEQIHFSNQHVSNVISGRANPSRRFIALVEEETQGQVTYEDFGLEKHNRGAANE